MNRQLYRYHPSWGYTFIPNLRTRIMHEGGGYLLSTNAQGFRSSHDFSIAKSDKKRILLFGDSYSAGMGVSDVGCYGSVIERQHSNWELFNFSLPGTGTDQHYLIYRDLAKTIECDLIVLVVQVENIRRVNSSIRQFEDINGNSFPLEKPYFTLESNKLVLHQYPPNPRPLDEEKLTSEQLRGFERGGRFEFARRTINRMGQPIKSAIQKITKIQPLPEYASEDSPSWQLLRAILAQWISEISQRVLLVPLPLYHYVEGLASPSEYRLRLRTLAEQAGAVWFDPLDDLLKYSAEDRRAMRFKIDVHPTPFMHSAIARVLEPQFKQMLEAS